MKPMLLLRLAATLVQVCAAAAGEAKRGLLERSSATSAIAATVSGGGGIGPEVSLAAGRLVGRWNKGVREFLGVPFAAPPVGPRRWLPPELPLPWAPDTLEATKVSPGCWRPDTWYTLNPVMSEDCLYLNIWTPPALENPHRRLAAVMVWIYGGGFTTDSGDDLQTRGVQLVRTFSDVVVITFNYRLGVLGFLGSESHRQYTYSRTGLNTTGNMGFLDQVQALRWVQANIEAFGGDPNNVMIFGESAGAGAVSAHLTSPWSAGLFHRAAMQSGGFNEWITMDMQHATDNFDAMVKTMRKLKKNYKRPWAAKYQCGKNLSDVQCLIESNIEPRHLVNIADGTMDAYAPRSSDWDTMLTCQWGPIVDGEVLKGHPFHTVARGHWNVVPVLMGMNMNDGTEFMDGCQNDEDVYGYPTCKMGYRLYNQLYRYFSNGTLIKDRNCFRDRLYRKWIELNWGADSVEPLFALYNSTAPSSGYATNFWAAEQLVGDFVMACTQLRAGRYLSANTTVFEYEFKRTPNEEPFGKHPFQPVTSGFGACHGCEIPFVFFRNDSSMFGISGDGEVELGLAMASYWTNFAWSGDPNRRGDRWSAIVDKLAAWPQRGVALGPLVLDASESHAEIRAAVSERGARCDAFWDTYFRRSGWFSDGLQRWGSWLRPPRPRPLPPSAPVVDGSAVGLVCSPSPATTPGRASQPGGEGSRGEPAVVV